MMWPPPGTSTVLIPSLARLAITVAPASRIAEHANRKNVLTVAFIGYTPRRVYLQVDENSKEQERVKGGPWSLPPDRLPPHPPPPSNHLILQSVTCDRAANTR